MERFYTIEHVLELVRRVYDVVVVSNDQGDFGVTTAFRDKNGNWMTMANAGPSKDYYDILYCLLWRIASFKETGSLPEGVRFSQASEDETPLDMAITDYKSSNITNDIQTKSP